MSLKFKKAIEQRLAWSHELRSLLTLPRTKNNQELLKTHFKNGTEQG
jgi:hypothetical protein